MADRALSKNRKRPAKSDDAEVTKKPRGGSQPSQLKKAEREALVAQRMETATLRAASASKKGRDDDEFSIVSEDATDDESSGEQEAASGGQTAVEEQAAFVRLDADLSKAALAVKKQMAGRVSSVRAGPAASASAKSEQAGSGAAAPPADDVSTEGRGVVYLGHIPHGFYEEQMQGFFSQFGEVTRLRMSRSKKTGRTRGYAFIEFRHHEVAEVVAKTMNNYFLSSKRLVCELVPLDKVHPLTFRGATHRFRVVPSRVLERRRHNKAVIGEAVKQRQQHAASREARKLAKLEKLGIKYQFTGAAEMWKKQAAQATEEAAARPSSAPVKPAPAAAKGKAKNAAAAASLVPQATAKQAPTAREDTPVVAAPQIAAAGKKAAVAKPAKAGAAGTKANKGETRAKPATAGAGAKPAKASAGAQTEAAQPASKKPAATQQAVRKQRAGAEKTSEEEPAAAKPTGKQPSVPKQSGKKQPEATQQRPATNSSDKPSKRTLRA